MDRRTAESKIRRIFGRHGGPEGPWVADAASRRCEAGQVGTWLVALVAALIVFFGTFATLRLARATDQAASIQTAADAAALAGAQEIAVEAPARLPAALAGGTELPCGLGQDSAGTFAHRNGSTLVSYCYWPAQDRVEVEVRSRGVVESGRHGSARASARVGARLGPCTMPTAPPPPPPAPTPTVSPSPSPSPTPSPTPPPDVTRAARCGDIEIPVVFPGGGGGPVIDLDTAWLSGLLDPRLIG